MNTLVGIDTNVLIRYIVQDDPQQSQQATDFIEQACFKKEILIFISGIILCELIWVLETVYEYSKADIVMVLEKILKTRQFHIHDTKILWHCLYDYQNLNIDFSDGYIAHLNAANECEYTLTFDKKAARLNDFKLLNS